MATRHGEQPVLAQRRQIFCFGIVIFCLSILPHLLLLLNNSFEQIDRLIGQAVKENIKWVIILKCT